MTREEREIITKHVEKYKLAKKSVRAYVNTIIKNGDYKEILAEHKRQIKVREDKTNEIKENFKKVNNKYKASLFVGMYGDFTDENHPDLVKQIMEKWDIPSFTEAIRYQHEHDK